CNQLLVDRVHAQLARIRRKSECHLCLIILARFTCGLNTLTAVRSTQFSWTLYRVRSDVHQCFACMRERTSMVEYIGVKRIRDLIERCGAAAFIAGLAAEIESDYRRWQQFEKSARHATHVPGGVIELMPASDGAMYSFKYVNGHPKNTADGLLTVTAFGVLAEV